MPISTLTATIEAGQSLSAPVDASAAGVVQINTPDAWDDANITFQVSPDGLAYDDLYLPNGQELMLPCEPNRAIGVNAEEWPAINFLKIRSGPAAAPVAQSAQRVFGVVVNTFLGR